MNDLDEHKWPAVVYFMICGVFFLACVWYLWTGALNPGYYWQPSKVFAKGSPESVMEKNDRILLVKNHGAQVDGDRIVYRGSQSGSIVMDLYILQLDPHYGYLHRIDEDQARTGFRMGAHHFQVVAASDAKISLKRL